MPLIISSQNSKPTIVIAGGGMVGMSLALALAAEDADWQIIVVESMAFADASQPPAFQPGFDNRSTAVSAGSIPLLRRIVCWRTLRQQAAAIKRVSVSDRGHYAGHVFDGAAIQQDPLGVVIENSWLGGVLRYQLAQQQHNIGYIAPAAVTGLQPVPRGVQLSIRRDGATQMLFADLVVIADGKESSLRHSLGIQVNTYHYHQAAVVANVALAQPHQGIAYEHFTDCGPLALLPLTDCDNQPRAALVWTHSEARLLAVLSWDEQTFIDHLHRQFGYRAGKIIAIGKRQGYSLQLIEAAEQVRSHVVVMGNAAHCLHPVAGQGFNLSLRDCATLVEVLIDAYRQGIAIGGYPTLAVYERRRALDRQITIGLTHQLVKRFSSRHWPSACLRQLGLLTLNALPAVHRRFARQLMGQPIYP